MTSWPLNNPRVSDHYGLRWHPIHGGERMHNGTDYAADGGTELYAIQRGTITAKGYNAAGAGHWVRLESLDEPGLAWEYWHMQQASPLGRGAVVAEGALVGWVGTTGSSTGNHLHLEQRFGGKLMDAHAWLLIATSAGRAPAASPATSNQDLLRGIDISKWQEGVDYGRVSTAVGFAYLKAGGSNTGSAYKDSRYDQHAAGFAPHLATVGSYWMNGHGDPTGDAEFFLSILRADADSFVALDLENIDGVTGWTPAQALAWFRRVRQGYSGPLFAYMNSSYASGDGDRGLDWRSVEAEGVRLIVANYGADDGTVSNSSPSTGTWSTWAVHQYTQQGTVPGYSGGVDLNRAKPGVFTNTEGDLTMSQVQEIKDHVTREHQKTRQLVSMTSPIRALTYKDGPDKGKIFLVSTHTGNRAHIPSPEFYVLNQAFGLFIGDSVTAEGHVGEYLRKMYAQLGSGAATQESLDATRDELLAQLDKLSPEERKRLLEAPENIGSLEVIEVAAESPVPAELT